ncbi:MAG: High-affinity zinc uptake system membrane protein ZnuB [candidate division WS6 bacterium OLB20]|uniref:High-affinity zinc uptake system membrane protein ZnuB n=1 Tax=candidate division WS6 bacterium OLB20 TaxID=1617426 RepID=A0A136LYW0_9BACT|nr:MAG: High-affinity zinc uptake system membrane protein ZnuB [candidate division WS6 bacterium OLB20]
MQRAITGGLIIAVLCACMGVFVTLRRESFLADAVAHASLSGVAVAFVLGWQPTLPAMAVGTLMSVAIVYIKKRTTISSDALIGIFYSALFALGVIIINLSPVYQPELSTYLFGSLLGISRTDLLVSIVVFAVIMILIQRLYQKLVFVTFDSESAWLHGIKTELLEYLLAIMASVTVIIAIKIVGIILVTALLLVPASTARLMAGSFRAMLPLAIAQSIIAMLGGIICAYLLDLPIGATIVLISTIIFMAVFVLRSLRR